MASALNARVFCGLGGVLSVGSCALGGGFDASDLFDPGETASIGTFAFSDGDALALTPDTGPHGVPTAPDVSLGQNPLHAQAADIRFSMEVQQLSELVFTLTLTWLMPAPMDMVPAGATIGGGLIDALSFEVGTDGVGGDRVDWAAGIGNPVYLDPEYAPDPRLRLAPLELLDVNGTVIQTEDPLFWFVRPRNRAFTGHTVLTAGGPLDGLGVGGARTTITIEIPAPGTVCVCVLGLAGARRRRR